MKFPAGRSRRGRQPNASNPFNNGRMLKQEFAGSQAARRSGLQSGAKQMLLAPFLYALHFLHEPLSLRQKMKWVKFDKSSTYSAKDLNMMSVQYRIHMSFYIIRIDGLRSVEGYAVKGMELKEEETCREKRFWVCFWPWLWR